MVSPVDPFLFDKIVVDGSAGTSAGSAPSIADEFSATHTATNALAKQIYVGYADDALFNSSFFASNATIAISLAGTYNLVDFMFDTDTLIYKDTVKAQGIFNPQISTLTGPTNSTSNSTINGYNSTLNNSGLGVLYDNVVSAANTLIDDNFGSGSAGQNQENADITAYNNAISAYNTEVGNLQSAQSTINGSINTYAGQLATYNASVSDINALVNVRNAVGLGGSSPQLSNGTSVPTVTTTFATITPTSIPMNTSSPYVAGTYHASMFNFQALVLPSQLSVPGSVTNPYSLPSSPSQYITGFNFFIINILEQYALQQGFITTNIGQEIANLVKKVSPGVVDQPSFKTALQQLGLSSSGGASGGPGAAIGAGDLNNPTLGAQMSLVNYMTALLTTPQLAQSIQEGAQRNQLNEQTIPLVIFGILLLGKSAQVAYLQSVEEIGHPFLAQLPPNQDFANLFGVIALAGALSNLLGSSAAPQGLSEFFSSLGPQANASATTQPGQQTPSVNKFESALIALVLTSIGAAIKNPALPNRVLSAANAVATGRPLPTIFRALTQNNLNALVQSGLIAKQFVAPLVTKLVNQGLSQTQAQALANSLSTQRFTSAAQLRSGIEAALKASGIAADHAKVDQIESSAAHTYGLSILQQSLSAVNAKAAQAVAGKYSTPAQFVEALQKYLGPEEATQALSATSQAFSGHVLGYEFAPSASAASANSLVSPASVPPRGSATPTVTTPTVEATPTVTTPTAPAAQQTFPTTLQANAHDTLVNNFLANTFGFVPGHVPSNTSLFHEQIKVLQRNYTQSQVDQTTFADHTAVYNESFKVYSDGNAFTTDRIMNPGNRLFTTWSEFQPKYTPNFQERPLEFQG